MKFNQDISGIDTKKLSIHIAFMLLTLMFLISGPFSYCLDYFETDTIELSEGGEAEQESEKNESKEEKQLDEYVNLEHTFTLYEAEKYQVAMAYHANWSTLVTEILLPPPEYTA